MTQSSGSARPLCGSRDPRDIRARSHFTREIGKPQLIV